MFKRHDDAINVMFMDSSARNVDIREELWSLKWNRNYDTRNEKAEGRFDWPDWTKK